MKKRLFVTIFTFNGKVYKLQSYKLFNVQNLLDFFGNNEGLSITEYNGSILHTKEKNSESLKNKDKIEVLTIVGGG